MFAFVIGNLGASISFLIFLIGSTMACEAGSAVYHLVTSDCPSDLPGPATSIPSESECVLRCTLSGDCRLSVYLKDSSACYSLPVMPLSTPGCSTTISVRQKMARSCIGSPPLTAAQPPTIAVPGVSTLSFASSVVIWYNFKVGFSNLANSLYPAEPANIVQQDPLDGVRLSGSSGSFVAVDTNGFSQYIKQNKKFTIYFQGKLAANSEAKCLSSFSSCSTYVSPFNTRGDGHIHSKHYLVDGSKLYAEINSTTGLVTDGIMKTASLGVSFTGSNYESHVYINGALYETNSPQKFGSAPAPMDSFNCLRIGDCKSVGPAPFNGSLECWGFVTESLTLNMFLELQNLCRG